MTVDIQATTESAQRVQRGPAAGMLIQFAVLAALAGAVGLHLVGWLVATAYAVATWAFLALAVHRSGTRAFGPANAVTLVRATFVGGVTALVADSFWQAPPTAVLVGLTTIALLLDAVDGQVARRTGTSSPLGAKFDGEIDAFLILVLSAFVAQSLGVWVLAIGLFRYAFVAAGWKFTWLRGDLPRVQSRSAIAAVQGIVLAVAASGLVPTPLMTAVVGVSLALLSFSFHRDVLFLWQSHQRQNVTEAPRPVQVGAR